MKTLGEFNGRETEAEFLVVDTAGKPVLGCKTSEDLGVLKINNVNVFTMEDRYCKRIPRML